ncbi:MAG: hypothetical protein ABSA72_05395 [Nitrososphaerales archaeon]
MALDPAIFLAALGITLLEFTEAAAVGLALYADSGKHAAFLYVALGSLVVLVPTILVGSLIGLLPAVYVRLVAGVLLLYFGLRLTKSARRSVVNARKGGQRTEHFEKGIMATGFSVGAVEAFEAAIVLVGLLPNGFAATLGGLGTGIVLVVIATYALRSQVRKVKQADSKIVVSALLLSFAFFWFGEAVLSPPDLVLVPLFCGFALAVYFFANRPSAPKVEGAAAGA